MADETKKDSKPPKPTERAVLVQIEVPREIFNEQLPEELAKLVSGFSTDTPVTAFVQIGEEEGSPSKVVDTVVGETPGTFRTPAISSWNGGIFEQGEETIPEQKKFRRRRVTAS